MILDKSHLSVLYDDDIYFGLDLNKKGCKGYSKMHFSLWYTVTLYNYQVYRSQVCSWGFLYIDFHLMGSLHFCLDLSKSCIRSN